MASIARELNVGCGAIQAARPGSVAVITRIVRMHFRPGEREAFLDIFNSSKHLIRQFDGCRHLGLYNEAGDPDVFFTFSVWQSAADLDAYRNSDLFRKTWKETKALFADKPRAWSMEELETV